KDPANILDVPGDIIDGAGKIIRGFQEWWLGKDTNCSSFAEYYGNRYAVCFAAAESKNITNPTATATFVNQLDQQCRSYFNQCYLSGKTNRICDAMRNSFSQQLQQLDARERASANAYSRELRHYVESQGAAVCNPAFLDSGYQEFIGQCGAALQRQVPFGGLDDTINGENSDNVSLTTNCVPSQPRFATDYVGSQACRAAVSQSDFNKAVGQRRHGGFDNGLNAGAILCVSDASR